MSAHSLNEWPGQFPIAHRVAAIAPALSGFRPLAPRVAAIGRARGAPEGIGPAAGVVVKARGGNRGGPGWAAGFGRLVARPPRLEAKEDALCILIPDPPDT